MVVQSLWFLKSLGDSAWSIVAGMEQDLIANPGVGALVANFNAIDAGVEFVIRETSAGHAQMTKRQEWNTPPRTLTVDIQPNVP